jgi:hypothetical protein
MNGPISDEKLAANLWWFIPLILLILSPIFFMFVSIPWQARKRGYSFWLWFAACVVTVNVPIYYLVLLAMLPNRRRLQLRQKFRAELDSKLANIAEPITIKSFAAPMPPGSTATVDRSLGDMPTIVPRERSLGDDETRG